MSQLIKVKLKFTKIISYHLWLYGPPRGSFNFTAKEHHIFWTNLAFCFVNLLSLPKLSRVEPFDAKPKCSAFHKPSYLGEKSTQSIKIMPSVGLIKPVQLAFYPFPPMVIHITRIS